MKISINRQACCAQDDQMGSLDMTIELSDVDDLETLTKKLDASGFLQYSSTHTVITGYIAELKVLGMTSKYHTDGKCIYHLPKETLALEVIGNHKLFFRW